MSAIFADIAQERKRQHEKWGEQNHPMLGQAYDAGTIAKLKDHYQDLNDDKTLPPCWFNILMEEVCEAFSETEPAKQREEMAQVAAVAVQIIECLDRRMEGNNVGYTRLEISD
jgi:hypothetical protein